MNKVIVTGRFTKEHEMRFTASGSAVINNSIAIDDFFGGQKRTDFVNVAIFGKIAEYVAERSKKGTKVTLFGKLRTNKYTNAEGKAISTTLIQAEEIEFHSFNERNATESFEDQTPNQSNSYSTNFGNGTVYASDDDLPF